MEPTTNDPDKFGLIMQCRASMDALLLNEVKAFAKKTLDRLSMKQLRAFMFIGLDGIRNDMEYAQILAIKATMNDILQKSKKKKTKQNPIANNSQLQSMTRILPEQVISSNICPYLLMPEVCKLANVNRAMCIIAHTPSSFSNLCIRHDPYRFVSNAFDDEEKYTRYTIDGNFQHLSGGAHLFRNVEKLSLCHDCPGYDELCFPKATHLTLAGYVDDFPSLSVPLVPSLTSIVFEGSRCTENFLDFLQRYKKTEPAENTTESNPADERKEQAYFEDLIYNMKSIAVVNCDFDTLHDIYNEDDDIVHFKRYQSLCKFLLPLQPNQLKVLKLEASSFRATVSQYCDEWNEQFVDLERIKTSLSGLEGFVYSQGNSKLAMDEFRLFHQLSTTILAHKNSFPALSSVHIHSSLLPLLLCGAQSVYSNFTAKPIKEFCATIPTRRPLASDFISKLQNICAHVSKCCLVFHITCGKQTKAESAIFARLCKNILTRAKSLKLFQIVLIIDDDCDAGNDSLCKLRNQHVVMFSDALMTELRGMSKSMFSKRYEKQPLVFKFHIKSMHRTLRPCCQREQKGFSATIRNLIFTYLLTFCSGIIQCKLSQNHWDGDVEHLCSELSSLDRLFDVDVRSGDCLDHMDNNLYVCNQEKDYAYYTISARTKNIDCNLEFDKRWDTDCEFCCNTPWL